MFVTRTLAIITTFAVGSVAAAAEEKPEHAELAKLIQQAVVAKAPREYEDRSGWGKTIPIPPDLPVGGLRTRVKVGDREELPDGVWQRVRVWFDDPAKDIQVRVLDVRPVEGGATRVSVEATAAFHGELERQRWRKGLRLFGITSQADAVVTATLDCDVTVSLDASKFPPVVQVEPKVANCRLGLKEFQLNRVGRILLGGDARRIGDDLKGLLQDLLRLAEPEVKERANQAIARSLAEGKGAISAAALLKAASAPKK